MISFDPLNLRGGKQAGQFDLTAITEQTPSGQFKYGDASSSLEIKDSKASNTIRKGRLFIT
jgi:hypothetical protein